MNLEEFRKALSSDATEENAQLKRQRIMNYFLAVNDRQLGTCLRMLFAEKLQPAVQTVLNEKGKIEFHISIAADQEVFEELNERYKIMIS